MMSRRVGKRTFYLLLPLLVALYAACAGDAVLDLQEILGRDGRSYQANDVYVCPDGYAYLALAIQDDGDFSGGLCFATLANPAKPGIVSIIPAPTPARRVLVEGDQIFLVEQERVSVHDRKDPAAPKPLGVIPVAAKDIAVHGGYIYLVGGEFDKDGKELGWLQICEFSGKTFRVIGRVNLPLYAYGICVAAGYAYVADGYGGLVVVNVSNPARPSVGATLKTPGFAGGVVVSGQFGYLALAVDVPGGAYQGVLEILDLSAPGRPSKRGSVVTTAFGGDPDIMSVAADRGRVYLVDSEGLHIFPAAEAKPRMEKTIPIGGIPTGLTVSGGRAYITYYVISPPPLWLITSSGLLMIEIGE